MPLGGGYAFRIGRRKRLSPAFIRHQKIEFNYLTTAGRPDCASAPQFDGVWKARYDDAQPVSSFRERRTLSDDSTRISNQ